MLALLSSLSIRRFFQLGAAAIVIGFLVGLWLDYAGRGREIARLQGIVAAHEEAARALDAKARILSTELERLTRLRSHQSETLREEIRRAPESDDAPVAPVLRRTLDGLRKR